MKPIRLLYVDDEAILTRSLKRLLERQGRFEVHGVNNPEIAVAEALRFGPDIILLDGIMPGISGAELASRLQSAPQLRSVPIVFYSGSQLGLGWPLLQKPAVASSLISFLEGNLDLSRIPAVTSLSS